MITSHPSRLAAVPALTQPVETAAALSRSRRSRAAPSGPSTPAASGRSGSRYLYRYAPALGFHAKRDVETVRGIPERDPGWTLARVVPPRPGG
jgi:hypothetical protein